jgi:hypothetical protein
LGLSVKKLSGTTTTPVGVGVLFELPPLDEQAVKKSALSAKKKAGKALRNKNRSIKETSINFCPIFGL